jgi:hypothetical protein
MLWTAALAALLLPACASVEPVPPAAPLTVSARDCFVFFDELDRVVHVAGSRDGGEHRVAGFPYLRVDRFTASFRDESSSDARYRAWVERMRALDERARSFEIANLPQEAFPILGTLDREQVLERERACGGLLVARHALEPAQRRRLPRVAVVPDDYSSARRVLGLYALTGMPFASSERDWQRHTRAVFASHREAPPPRNVAYHRYLPREQPMAAQAALAQARSVLAAAPVDALGVPRIDEAGRELLFDAFAPSFEIATRADYDRFGPLQWIDLSGLVARDADRYWLDVDPSQPVVYRRLAFTRHGDAVLPQLVYTIWFSERPLQDSGDLLGGRIDGLVWRVTLDEKGVPLLFDTIQPSGRFAMFFPTARLQVRPAPRDQPLIEWAFSPIEQPIEQWVGAGPMVAGVSLRIESQTHQLVGIGLPGREKGEPVARNNPYRMLDANGLRALPLPGGGSRSIYDANGIVPNTERMARYFFWPMGISSPGSMRQWGRQPTAFVGRRHFDDADLIEKRFERQPEEQSEWQSEGQSEGRSEESRRVAQ